MTTEEHVMHLLERAKPRFDQQDLSPRVDASGYLDTLEQRSSTIMSEPDVSTHSTQRLWLGLAAAAAVVALIGALLLVNREDDPVPVDEPDPTTVPSATESEQTTPPTEEPTTTTGAPATTTTSPPAPATTLFTVPTGVPEISEWRDGIPLFQAIGDGSALVDLEQTVSTPQVLEATNQTGSSGAFSVRLLDADRTVTELVVDNDGARSGSYLVNLEQLDVAHIAVTADGDWSLNLYDPDVNVEQWSGTEPFRTAGPDVVRFTGDATTVVFVSGRNEPFVISTYDAVTGIETIADGTGPAEVDLSLPAGPVSVVVEATGNWSFEPATSG